ncbi:MAG: sodium-dependent transporter, partial [Anaerovoracaceae bacterium]
MERERLGSRLGFILISAGCAIGIGNVWKFPYLVGQNGGGLFVLIYLFFLVILGIPVMTMEFSMGRASRRSPVRMYQQLEPAGTKWHLHGYVAMIGNIMLMMYYTTVAGWMLEYFVMELKDDFKGLTAPEVANVFSGVMASPLYQIIAVAVVVFAGFFICGQGLQNGLEKVTKVMMIMLLILILVLAVHSILLPRAKSGLSFYLKPSIENMKNAGYFNVIVAAMNQAFFTLSLGVGAMAIFGSYIGNDRSLTGESVMVAVLDTFVAIMAGLIIFPACSAFGVDVGSGPSLIFITLPNIFNHMPAGQLWGVLFFLFMVFAAFSTVTAVFENIIACIMDLSGWTRRKASVFGFFLIFALSIPCVLGFNVLSGLHPLGGTSSVMDFEDFIVSSILLPLGSLIFVLFCTR